MTNEEFLKKVNGARDLLKDILHHEVKVKLKSKDGLTVSDHFKLTELSYMFSPFFVNEDGTKGSLVKKL